MYLKFWRSADLYFRLVKVLCKESCKVLLMENIGQRSPKSFNKLFRIMMLCNLVLCIGRNALRNEVKRGTFHRGISFFCQDWLMSTQRCLNVSRQKLYISLNCFARYSWLYNGILINITSAHLILSHYVKKMYLNRFHYRIFYNFFSIVNRYLRVSILVSLQ